MTEINLAWKSKVDDFTTGIIAETLRLKGFWMFGGDVDPESRKRVRELADWFLLRFDKYFDVMNAALPDPDYIRYGRMFVQSCLKREEGFRNFYQMYTPAVNARYSRALIALAGKPLQILCENLKLKVSACNTGTEAEPCITVDIRTGDLPEFSTFWLESKLSKWDNRVPGFVKKVFTVPKRRKTRRRITGTKRSVKSYDQKEYRKSGVSTNDRVGQIPH
jgi:hypothetical protein